jgi:hypothetical protein
MVHRPKRRLRERAPRPLLLRAPAEDLPFEDDSFDVAVSTLVLCTVDDQPRALREVRRVLRPGGRLFIERVRGDDQRLAKWQDRLTGSRHALDTAATATAQQSRRSPRPASKSPSSSATYCARHHRSCGHSSSASRKPTVPDSSRGLPGTAIARPGHWQDLPSRPSGQLCRRQLPLAHAASGTNAAPAQYGRDRCLERAVLAVSSSSRLSRRPRGPTGGCDRGGSVGGGGSSCRTVSPSWGRFQALAVAIS